MTAKKNVIKNFEDISHDYTISPYKAMEYTKQAQSIVSKLVSGSSSFTKPYTEAKIILVIAQTLIEKSIELFEITDEQLEGEKNDTV